MITRRGRKIASRKKEETMETAIEDARDEEYQKAEGKDDGDDYACVWWIIRTVPSKITK
jgi:hypothetical protein